MNANMLQVTTPQSRLPELIAAAGERASMRFLEFFAANIRNPHTRRAYARVADEFLAWCSQFMNFSRFSAFRPLQARQSEKIRSRCAVFRQFPEFSHGLHPHGAFLTLRSARREMSRQDELRTGSRDGFRRGGLWKQDLKHSPGNANDP